MSYRPPGFDESLDKALGTLRTLLGLPESGERRDELMAGIGADAMYEALKAERLSDCTLTTKSGHTAMVDLKGTLIFIPDEEGK